jgi:uncharacterized paraquat-inducible protein A
VSYLQCPECRLTVPAAAYYLRGDECPRCLTTMEAARQFPRARAAPQQPAAPARAPAGAAD